MQESRNTITVPSTFILRILAYLNRRRRRESNPCAVSPPIPCAVSPVHSMCSVPSPFHVQCPQFIPCAVSPLHSMCSVPISLHVQCPQFIPCAVSPLHSTCSVPSSFHVQCPQSIPCAVCPFHFMCCLLIPCYKTDLPHESDIFPLVQREQQAEDND